MFGHIFKTKRKVPTVLQMEAVECGAASLAMILAYYGTYVPLEKLRIQCGISRDGSKASNLLKVARQYGLEAKGYRKEPEDLRSVKTPMIVHWEFNHFLVVERIDKNDVYLVDPASGPKKISFEVFDLSFTGVVLEFIPTEAFKKIGQKPKITSMLSRRMRGTSKELLFLLLVGFCLALPGIVTPIFSKIFVDDILLSNRAEWLIPLLCGMAFTSLLRGVLTWMRGYYLLRFETKLSIQNAAIYLWHVLHLPVEFFTQRFSGDISSRMENNNRIAQALSGKVATTVLNCVMLIFYILLMLYYNVALTLLVILTAIVNILVLKKISKKRIDINQKLLVDKGKMQGTSISGIRSIETLKATGAESDFFAKWAGYHGKVLNGEQEMGKSNILLSALPSLLSKLSYNAVLIFGGIEIMKGNMTIGMLVAFQSLVVSFMQPVTDLVNLADDLQRLTGDMNRVDDVMNYPKDTNFAVDEEASVWQKPILEKLSGHIEIKDLSFGYNPIESPLIENFSVSIPSGARIALVGGSGSGKSTLARLIAGLYQPWTGEILFDGIGRQSIPKKVVVNSLAVVDQDISMFHDSVENNVSLWNDNIPEETIVKACKDACIHDDISKKQGGYEHVAKEDGGNFSGGQRQRLEIARTLAINPTILILDEATSALDPQTERIIDGNIRRRGCTCIIVAHRLSTIRDCDEIIVLEKGKVVERGTHMELKAQNGYYMSLLDAH